MDSTQGILDEGRPLLCPFDTSMMEIMERFNDFLPTKVRPEEFQYTHELWFDEMINIWIESKNNSLLDEVRSYCIIYLFIYLFIVLFIYLLYYLFIYLFIYLYP